MNPYAAVLCAYAAFRGPQIEKAHRDPMDVQGRKLLSLVRRAADTAWGRRFAYGSIRSVEEYQRCVPIQDYTGMVAAQL